MKKKLIQSFKLKQNDQLFGNEKAKLQIESSYLPIKKILDIQLAYELMDNWYTIRIE